MATHYEVLGIAQTAGPDDVRRAYHELARRLHPDRLLDVTPAELARAGGRMRDVNEAWRVLREPASRASYDRSLLPARSAPAVEVDMRAGGEGDDDLVDVAPIGGFEARVVSSLPWVLLIGVLFAIFVFTAYAAGGSHRAPSVQPAADVVGTCVGSMPAAVTTSVPCGDPGARTIVTIVGGTERCPDDTTRFEQIDKPEDLCLRS